MGWVESLCGNSSVKTLTLLMLIIMSGRECVGEMEIGKRQH